MSSETSCTGRVPDNDDHMGVRISAVFVVLVTSAGATLFPIVTRRLARVKISENFYDFAKYFGSGVIIATAFVHLLQPAQEELGHTCLLKSFQEYPMAYAFALISMMIMFLGEFYAYRFGAEILERHGLGRVSEQHTCGPPDARVFNEDIASEQPSATHDVASPTSEEARLEAKDVDPESGPMGTEDVVIKKQSSGTVEVIGVFVLELGILFHSVIIGITLSTTEWNSGAESFFVLYPAIIFHQLFEGLGLGARLAFMPSTYSVWFLCFLGMLYALCTPIGMALGLGIRRTYSPDTPTFYYVSGVFDAVSAGILIYSSLVELMAHDFIFNKDMYQKPLWKATLNILELWAGTGVMALIGRWA